ncbi:hypothetical protein K466DRAFT_642486 [Polyporus arcularius HHB13444]|uniref:Arrestin-like N-terminal domain-containing protein n=1 Tax=Polyporus arcularius HHB13444 TaxID=1314778 RepID=A0A5C3PYR5_9APHY|nr:hypothetical protein K466DRAFT_642486 [Polyporus arcularius HHB13444]
MSSSITTQSAYSLAMRKPALHLTVPATIYVAGGSVMGEVELNHELALEDDIERVYVELQGTIKTKNRMGPDVEQFQVESNDFLRKTLTLWRRDRSEPPADGGPIILPFELKLPEDAPPSFQFESYMNNAYVRYAVEVTGVRNTTFAVDRTFKSPIVVVQPDPIGSAIRAELKLGWSGTWGRLKSECNMRKYPWGEYAHAKLELLVPHVDTFPLFSDIPYTIVVTTTTAPMKRKGDAAPEKSLYPSAPRNPSELDFELRRFVDMKTPYQPSNPEEHVIDIISKAHAPTPPVEVEVGNYHWLPDGQKTDRGRWSQEVSFHSVMNFRFTPTFLTEELKIKYTLILRMEFPGLGNVLRVELPINIGSGVESSFPSADSPRTVELPGSYWKTSEWTDN